jgi:hypothetical protein
MYLDVTGTTPFREALIEIKRPPRRDQDRAGFACCEALVGSSIQGVSAF